MLPEAERFLALLPEPALLADGSGVILHANHALGALTGTPATALAGTSLAVLVADPPDKVAEYLRLCARSRQLLPGAFRWLGRQGRPIEMRCDGAVLAPRRGTEPSVLFVRGRPRDEATEHFSLLNRKIEALSKEILERKRIQQERDALLQREREARLEAERIGQLKDEFLATLSHELRTPLNAILGWAQVLRSPPNADNLPRGLEVIERNARVQVKIIDDLLDMSRIISGRIRLDVQAVALASVIDAALDSVRPALEAKSMRLQTMIDPIAGPVKGDPSRLQQVVWNLLMNAIKFTPKGGRVQVSLERVNSHVEITVSDSGEGIEPDFLPHVFDRFRQADGSTTRRHGGLGLGLSIVKQLVELHGGSVRAKSAGRGQGATFVVALPVVIVHEGAADSGRHRQHPAAESAAPVAVPDGVLRGLRALVVDDEPDARELLRTLLEAHGAQVDGAATVRQGLAALGAARYDIVLCDIGMPDEDGYAFARRARQMTDESVRHVPILAVTAFARVEDRTRALLAGFTGHLSKPVETAELIATVASMAGRIRQVGADPEEP